jgi:exodeoxyribonuclease-5
VAVAQWLADPQAPQVFRLFGYAGTGKTTLARHFGQGIDGTVLYMAYTGKAAYVLRQKGCPDASTIHSIIYNSKELSREKLRDLERSLVELRAELKLEIGASPEMELEGGPPQFTVDEQVENHPRVMDLVAKVKREREALSRPMFTLNTESVVKDAKLVIIDEVSMVDGPMGEDLESFGTKILVLGDPAQLPPVYGAGFFTEGIEPDVMLTDIHRQAESNPIIAMATRVRNQEDLAIGSYGNSLVAEKVHINESHAQAADQILVGRNKTRHASNRRMRALYGRTDTLPVAGDKLVCLRNNHDRGLLNGAIWFVNEVGLIEDERVFMILRPEDDGPPLEVEAHTQYFLGQGEALPWWERKNAEEFDYGYSLTVHKAQGSEWDDVLLFDESHCFRADKWRWLYTGITRAAERVVVVRM